MNNFLVKLLHPKTYIRVLVANPDRSLRARNVVPKNGAITIGSKVFLITDDTPWMRTGKNIPCYIVAHNRAKPLDLYAENGPESVRRDSEKTPSDIKAFVDSNAFQRMARKRSGKDIMVYMMIGAVILIAGFYMIYMKTQELGDAIAALKTLIESTGA